MLTLIFTIPRPISRNNPNFAEAGPLKNTKELMSASTDLWPRIRKLGIMLHVKMVLDPMNKAGLLTTGIMWSKDD